MRQVRVHPAQPRTRARPHPLSTNNTRVLQRTTRKLSLTEAGEGFLASIGGNLEALQEAISAVSSDRGEPAGVLTVISATQVPP